MPEQSDWSTLNQRAASNGAFIVLRAETFGDGESTRFSLAAKTKAMPKAMVYDARADLGDSAPQTIVTQLVTKALAEWWA